MQHIKNMVANTLRAVILFITIPITIFYFIALGMTFLFLRSESEIFEFIKQGLFCLSSGYGMYSFWWLIFKFDKISFSEIPRTIKIGLVCGSIMSIAYLVHRMDKPLNGLPGDIFLQISPVLPLMLLSFLLFYDFLARKKFKK